MVSKILICGAVGAAVVGGMRLMGIDVVVSLVLALFAMVVVATMVVQSNPSDSTDVDHDNSGGDGVSDRTNSSHAD